MSEPKTRSVTRFSLLFMPQILQLVYVAFFGNLVFGVAPQIIKQRNYIIFGAGFVQSVQCTWQTALLAHDGIYNIGGCAVECAPYGVTDVVRTNDNVIRDDVWAKLAAGFVAGIGTWGVFFVGCVVDGFYLLQAVFGTTVIPLCEPNEMENCTTALIQTDNNPQVAQVRITRCKPDMQDYCFHGHCMYLVDLNKHYCWCEVGFSGDRCVHLDFLTQHLSKEYLALTILIPLFLIAILIAAFYLYKWYQNKKKRQANNREYEEVDVHEKNSTLLHM